MKILNSINQRKFLSFVLILSVIAIQDTNAQRKKRKKKNTKASQVVAPKPKPKKKEKSIADLTKSSKKIEGLFTIFQDTVTGATKLLVKEDGILDFIVTDPSPAPPEIKELQSGDFSKAWGGIAGLQFSLPVVLLNSRL